MRNEDDDDDDDPLPMSIHLGHQREVELRITHYLVPTRESTSKAPSKSGFPIIRLDWAIG